MSDPVEFGPLEHYDYDQIETCDCLFCRDYRRLMKVYHKTLKYCDGHKKRCKCKRCVIMKRARVNFIAVSSKRDVYSEFSYMMRGDPMGSEFMRWLREFIETYEQTLGWWYSRSACVPRKFWIMRFYKAKPKSTRTRNRELMLQNL